MSNHLEAFSSAKLREALAPVVDFGKNDPKFGDFLGQFYKQRCDSLREHHFAGGGGIENAEARSRLVTAILIALFERAHKAHPSDGDISLIATGGFGRGLLNPKSDVDLLFLTKRSSQKLKDETEGIINENLYPLWDLGLEVGYAVRSKSEMIDQGKIDPHAKTSLLESRFIAGEQLPFDQLKQRFTSVLVEKRREEFVEDRVRDMQTRHGKYNSTVFLQEPQVKESPGGLRDYHHLLWFTFIMRGTLDASDLVEADILREKSYNQLQEAYEFLHRVRNGLHYEQNRSTDILTLRLQGVIAEQMNYPQKDILRKIEAFMKEYYLYTRLIYDRTQSVAEIFQLECQRKRETGLAALVKRPPKPERIEGFTVRGDLIEAPLKLFKEQPKKLLQIFQIAQKRSVFLSPKTRRHIKSCWDLIDRGFRSRKENREIFRSILQQKGEVGSCLRAMHRVGVLGRYLPEFGALDCLVQHEFFHRYTADEHTLRCIEELDKLADEGPEFFRKLFRKMEDPYAVYLSLILHDTGRAENVREHTDGSAMLAMRVCNRFQISGNRRRLIMFLVDHHLSFWRYATTRNLEDEEVIREFAGIMKSKSRLDALLLFTFADSHGTNEEAWNSWKESLMLQLYRATRNFLEQGSAEFEAERQQEKEKLYEDVSKRLDDKELPFIKEHFILMPERYFHFRSAEAVARHVRALNRFHELEDSADNDGFVAYAVWKEHKSRGYSSLNVIARDRDFFLERLCCALAKEQLNILSADIFTRPDGLVVDVIRVAQQNGTYLSNKRVQKRIIETLNQLHNKESYSPENYLKKKNNYLGDTPAHGLPFPVRAIVRNELSAQQTALEIQAIDRIGLLHDIFTALSDLGVEVTSARISTEKGAAVDTFYIATEKGQRVTDEDLIEKIETVLEPIISQMEEEAV